MSTFIELDSIPEVTETTAGGSLLLPNLVRGLGLKEDDPEEMELMQAANMKILDEYHRCFMEGDDISFDDDGADDSMDSFAASDLDSNQSLIEEVETYLQGVSGGIATTAILMPEEEPKAVLEAVEMKAVIPAVARQETVIRKQQQQQSSKLTAEDNSRILKAMVEGKVLAPPADNIFDDSFTSGGSSCDGSFELTEEDLVNAYTTTIKTENGQDVIIIIAQPGSPASSRYVPDMVAASPSLGSPAYAASSCSDDYEWSPSPQQQQQSAQRKKYQRKNRPTLLAEPYPRYIWLFIIVVAQPDPDSLWPVGPSVADLACLSIPDPDFYPSRIPDPKTVTKERGKKIVVIPYICSHKFHKIGSHFICKMLKKKKLVQFSKNYRTFTRKIVTKLSKIWVWDPGFGIRNKPIPDPGVKKALDPGSGSATLVGPRIRNPYRNQEKGIK
jgi:hypothetical protein